MRANGELTTHPCTPSGLHDSNIATRRHASPPIDTGFHGPSAVASFTPPPLPPPPTTPILTPPPPPLPLFIRSGGLPFFYNRDTHKFICGPTSFDNLMMYAHAPVTAIECGQPPTTAAAAAAANTTVIAVATAVTTTANILPPRHPHRWAENGPSDEFLPPPPTPEEIATSMRVTGFWARVDRKFSAVKRMGQANMAK